MNDNNPTSTNTATDTGLGGGLIAALIAFALTWFVVNGGELPEERSGTLNAGQFSVCAVPADIPTSRFLNAPVMPRIPLAGG